MKLIVITHKRTGKVIAVVENPNYGSMSKGAVALAWSKANGYERIPTDVDVDEVNLTSFSHVMFGVIPKHIGDEIRTGQYED